MPCDEVTPRQPTTYMPMVGPRRSSEAMPKASIAPKNGNGDFLVISSRFDPPPLPGPGRNHQTITARSAVKNSTKCTKICVEFTRHWSRRCNHTSWQRFNEHARFTDDKKGWLNWDMKPSTILARPALLSPEDYHLCKRLNTVLL